MSENVSSEVLGDGMAVSLARCVAGDDGASWCKGGGV